jgi:hypothetical protein
MPSFDSVKTMNTYGDSPPQEPLVEMLNRTGDRGRVRRAAQERLATRGCVVLSSTISDDTPLPPLRSQNLRRPRHARGPSRARRTPSARRATCSRSSASSGDSGSGSTSGSGDPDPPQLSPHNLRAHLREGRSISDPERGGDRLGASLPSCWGGHCPTGGAR